MSHDPARLLLVTRNLPPLVGGMERLVWNIARQLAARYTLQVIGPTGAAARLPDVTSFVEVPIKPLPLFFLVTCLRTLWAALSRRPAVILAGSGLVAPFVWCAARLCGAKAVVYLHGLDVEARHPLYRWLFRPCLRRFDHVFVNSRFTRQLALDNGIPEGKISVIHPGVSLPDLSLRDDSRARFRDAHGLGDRPLLLFIGRITPRKGLAWFIQHVWPTVIQAMPEARLLVVGDEPRDAASNLLGEIRKIRDSLQETGIAGDTVIWMGAIDDDAVLRQVYFASDVHVFPVRPSPGDNEGFGMVAIEAAAHGVPTVVCAVAGVVDAVRAGVSGTLVDANDAPAFAQAVIRYSAAGPDDAAHEFAKQFSWERFAQKLYAEIDALLER